MPITRKQFEMGISSKTVKWMEKVYDYLAQHKDEAFTDEELAKVMGVQLRPLIILTFEDRVFTEEGKVFRDSLDKLVEVGAAEKRLITGDAYYTIGTIPLKI